MKEENLKNVKPYWLEVVMTKDNIDYGKTCLGFGFASLGYISFMFDEYKDKLCFDWENCWKKRIMHVLRLAPVILTAIPVVSPFIISHEKDVDEVN